MTWKEDVALLEQEGNFDIAVFLLEKVIEDNPDEMDAYIFLLYRFMDSSLDNTCYWANSNDPLRKIKEAYCEEKIWHGYAVQAQKCFDESYAKFSENPAYLYYASKILRPFYWFLGLKIEDTLLENMLNKAKSLGYNAILEQNYPNHMTNDSDTIAWAKRIMNDPSLKEQLATKGAAAQYVIGEDFYWARRILDEEKKQIQ